MIFNTEPKELAPDLYREILLTAGYVGENDKGFYYSNGINRTFVNNKSVISYDRNEYPRYTSACSAAPGYLLAFIDRLMLVGESTDKLDHLKLQLELDEIQREMVEFKDRLFEAKARLIELKSKCTHPNYSKKIIQDHFFEGEVVEYKECTCLDCGQFWEETGKE